MGSKKRHRSYNSSQSDLDASLVSPSDSKKKKRKSKKKKMATKMEDTIEESATFSKKTDEINLTLNNILTKDDTGLIK